MAFPKYETYKDSGVDWLGEIPSHWETIRAKYVLKEVDERSKTGKEELLSVSHLTGVTSRIEKNVNMFLAEDYSGSKLCQQNDIVVNTMWAWMGALGVSPIEGIVSSSYGVYRPNNKVFPKFIDNLLRTSIYVAEYNRRSTGVHSSRLRLYPDKFLDIPLLLPLFSEQKRISEFIERTTAEIDEAIAKKQRLIELLQEQKAILINQAVTKGLNPNVPMRDSGVEWIGEIPEHWETLTVKQVARNGYKTFIDGDWIESPYITDDGVRLIQTGNIGTGKYKEKGFRYISEVTFNKLNCTEVFPGDVLICRLDGPVGRACIAPSLGCKMITSVDNVILKPSNNFDCRFIVYLMSSNSWLEWIQALCRVGGGFRFRISRSMLGNLKIPKPSIEEQLKIADWLDSELNNTYMLINKLLESIKSLNEYRQVIISQAVTGKIKI
ncbi:MAG: restriction endonuclease subunit S [Cyanobacteria bacterium P01_C01_bin.38]